VPDPLEINDKWELRYYAFAEGGYHRGLMRSGGYGNIAMTLVVRMGEKTIGAESSTVAQNS
jgi:hypothetical protein